MYGASRTSMCQQKVFHEEMDPVCMYLLTIELASVHFFDLKSENSDRNENLPNPIFLNVCLSLSKKSSEKFKWELLVQASFFSPIFLFTSIKEFPLYEFLDAKGFHADPNEPDIVLLEDWLQSGYLLRTQSAEGSSEAAEEDNHASVRPPQVAVFDRLFQRKKFL